MNNKQRRPKDQVQPSRADLLEEAVGQLLQRDTLHEYRRDEADDAAAER
jgi:hypothetical protein